MYCDTDSVAAASVATLPLGGALGEWKLELVGDEYAIAGKKLYAFAGKVLGDSERIWKTASKGTRLEASDIVRVARGETVYYDPAVPTYTIHNDNPQFVRREIKNTVRYLQPFS